MKYIFKKIIIKDFSNSVEETAGYIEVLFQKQKYVGLNENCFIGHLVV